MYCIQEVIPGILVNLGSLFIQGAVHLSPGWIGGYVPPMSVIVSNFLPNGNGFCYKKET